MMSTATTETVEKTTWVSGKAAAELAGLSYLRLVKLAALGAIRTRAALGQPVRYCAEDAARYREENG